jgi:hypothetical protein
MSAELLTLVKLFALRYFAKLLPCRILTAAAESGGKSSLRADCLIWDPSALVYCRWNLQKREELGAPARAAPGRARP